MFSEDNNINSNLLMFLYFFLFAIFFAWLYPVDSFLFIPSSIVPLHFIPMVVSTHTHVIFIANIYICKYIDGNNYLFIFAYKSFFYIYICIYIYIELNYFKRSEFFFTVYCFFKYFFYNKYFNTHEQCTQKSSDLNFHIVFEVYSYLTSVFHM